ncbi:hypothetical protein J2S43_008127 [Catenuloplanes nepalensis]|uniref:Uncharacterized protein n=1 Tax=Catenuloplanes nepalensis TaxID=587533 RepID=A0ABT9N7D3_9ACTN|nr:hypothetical protein [Catenuloplanes nepalensis]MDP9799615.1 hypothetical protein [Catenuloplanes nepalensis]
MRMVFTDAPEDEFIPARDRLVGTFERWARRARRDVDPFMAEVLIEQRWSVGDGLLGRWRPEDLRFALIEYFPRGVTTREWSATIPTLHAFVDFLFDADLADAKCADAAVLHTTLGGLEGEFDAAMADETRFGPAKFWSMRMLDAGINLDDHEAMHSFIADVQAGRVPYDEAVLAKVVRNQLTDEDETPPALPPIDPPPRETVVDAAAGSVTLSRLLRFTEWVGDGRALTPKGNLKLADTAELIALFGLKDVLNPVIGDKTFKTTSSEELYETSLLFAWAKEARFVRVVKGRLLPVKSAAKTLKDPVAAAERAFEAFFRIGRAVCPPAYFNSIVPFRSDDFTFALLMAMYLAQRPIEADELGEIVGGLVEEFLGFDPDDRGGVGLGAGARVHDNDVERLLTQLDLLGAVRHDASRTSMTALGTALFQTHLRGMGIEVPTIDDLLDETAEVVVALAADTPSITAPLLTRWRDHRPEAARAELRALAARTDDPEHRALAETYGGRRLTARPHAVSARRPKKRRR